MKVTVIGGGSSYTPELINGFLERVDSFPLVELWLMDIAPERLEIVGRFAQRMVAAKGGPFTVHLTTDQRKAVRNASYVITQLRIGGMQARRADEYLGRRHGLVGQETTGVGGMAKALRTIPVVLNIAADMRELAPGTLLVNFQMNLPEAERACEREAVWLDEAVFRAGRQGVDNAVAALRKIYDNRTELAAKVDELRAALCRFNGTTSPSDDGKGAATERRLHYANKRSTAKLAM